MIIIWSLSSHSLIVNLKYSASYAATKARRIRNKDVLLQLWGDDSYFNTRSLHVFITKLRHKLSRDPRIRIINVRGIGYKLI